MSNEIRNSKQIISFYCLDLKGLYIGLNRIDLLFLMIFMGVIPLFLIFSVNEQCACMGI